MVVAPLPAPVVGLDVSLLSVDVGLDTPSEDSRLLVALVAEPVPDPP